MTTFQTTAKISSKGQITLPKPVRSVLQANIVRIVVDEGSVRLDPVRDLAGSLKQYAQRQVAPQAARDQAWSEAMDEKHGRR